MLQFIILILDFNGTCTLMNQIKIKYNISSSYPTLIPSSIDNIQDKYQLKLSLTLFDNNRNDGFHQQPVVVEAVVGLVEKELGIDQKR